MSSWHDQELQQTRRGLDDERLRRGQQQANGRHESASRRSGALWDIAVGSTRYALRRMRRSPGFTLGVVFSFALGIGANATMFGIIDRLLLRPPAHVIDAGGVQRLMVDRVLPATGTRETVDLLSFPDYVDFTHARTFASVAAINTRTITVGRGPEARQHRAGVVTGNFFSLLGARPAAGTFFVPDHDRAGAPGVVVIGYEMWRREFGGDLGVIGRSLDFGSGPYTVVGVAPKGFTGVDLRPIDVWLPLRTVAAQTMGIGTLWMDNRNLNWLRVVARLAPGVTPKEAEAEATILHRRGRDDQIDGGRYDPRAQAVAAPLIAARGPLASRESKVATWLAGISLLVLLIACANVANLLLAEGVRRRREIGIRLALGGSRGRVLGQVLADSLLPAILGGLAALLLASWSGDMLRSVLLPDIAWSESAVGVRAFGFVMALSLLAGATAGIIPAVQTSRPDVLAALNSATRSISASTTRTRDALIVVQAALAVVLLVGAGLFVHSLRKVNSVDMGLDPEGVLLMTPILDRGTTDERSAEFMRRAAQRLRAFPGVVHTSTDVSVPFWSAMGVPLRVPGLDSVPTLPTGGATMHAIDPDYFQTLRIKVLRGRGIQPQDNRMGAARVVVVNETMANALWPGQEAVGRCLIIRRESKQQEEPPCATVVGVVENARRSALIEGETMQYYFPAEQNIVDASPAGLLVRVQGDAQAMIPSIRRELSSLEPALRYAQIRPLRELTDPETQAWKLGAAVFTAFGLLALLVAGIGLYSVLAFTVAQRTVELAIRAALGATRPQLLRMILWQVLRLVTVGIALGLTIALTAAPSVEPLLFGVSPHDPATLAAVVGSLVLVTVVAAIVPARRATRANTSAALRAE